MAQMLLGECALFGLVIAVVAVMVGNMLIGNDFRGYHKIKIDNASIDQVWNKVLDFEHAKDWQTEIAGQYSNDWTVYSKSNEIARGDIIGQNGYWMGRPKEANWTVLRVVGDGDLRELTMRKHTQYIADSTITFYVRKRSDTETIVEVEEIALGDMTVLGKMLYIYMKISGECSFLHEYWNHSLKRFSEQLQQ